jgi:hypothetical protein
VATRYYDKALQENLNIGVSTGTRRSPAGGTLTGTQIGIHSFAVGQAQVTATWDPGSVAAGSSTSTTVTVPGAAMLDFVRVAFSLDLQGMDIGGYVSAPNTVTVLLSNLTGAAIDLGSGTLAVLVERSR